MSKKNEKGQTLVFGALSLAILLGFAGMGIDMGVLRYERRLQQTAADAAAVAAASNIAYGGVQAGGQNVAASSGYTDASGNDASQCTDTAQVSLICVQVISPPGPATVNGQAVPPGPHNGQAGYAEVLVAVVQPTYFMRILNMPQRTVVARAVATNISGGGPLTGCLYTLGPPASSIEGVNINGSATLNAPTCGIGDNGNYNTKGNALVVTANTFGVSGDANQSGPGGTVTCTSGQNPCPTYGMPAAADPLAYLTPPAVQSPSFGDVTTSGTMTLQPGTYSSITFGKNSTTTLNAGIYYINGAGGVTFNGAGTVTGAGVMFYFTNGATINATGGGNKIDIQLSPRQLVRIREFCFTRTRTTPLLLPLVGITRAFSMGFCIFQRSSLHSSETIQALLRALSLRMRSP